MKRYLVFSCLIIGWFAQLIGQASQEIVSIGAGYSNQTWYQLQSGNETTAPAAEWDLAFELSAAGSSILINSPAQIELWNYPNSDTSGWLILDTAGIETWQNRWNSDTSWALGAFSNAANPNDPFDLDWGTYNTFTHAVTADSLYVIKLANGAYKKLWVRELTGGTYSFTYADIGGSNESDRFVTKSNFVGKNFAYYSIENDTILDREPISTDWDLLFTKYTAFIPLAYPVSGVLANVNTEIAQVEHVGNVNTYTNWGAATFQTPVNTIGYDWKAYTGAWVIEDSLLYFVKTQAGDVWKLVFTGFGGSGNGEFRFTKELMAPTATDDFLINELDPIKIFPNPVRQGALLSWNLSTGHRPGKVTAVVRDLNGQEVYRETISRSLDQQSIRLPLNVVSGLYLLELKGENLLHYQQIMVQ